MIKVIIADDQEIVREGLKMVLSLHEDIEIVDEASNGKELLDILACRKPDVILTDIRMPIMDGIEAIRLVKGKYPDIKIIILTTFDDDEYIFQGLKNGADGYILKDSNSKEIVESIRTAYEGNVLLNPRIAVKVVQALNSINFAKQPENNSPSLEGLLNLLTPREFEVTKHILQGKSNKAIGDLLFVTEGTIKNYVSRILEKLELSSRAELIIHLQKNSFF
jgi:DNA-binding NarL/FixJ family response regulator